MADRIVTAWENDRTPNWDKWRLIRTPQLWQCVALSLNIDPDKVKIYYDEMSGDVTFNESQEFQDRLHVLRTNFGRDGVPVHPRSCPASLRTFAAEVRRIGCWEAPAELLAMADKPRRNEQGGVYFDVADNPVKLPTETPAALIRKRKPIERERALVSLLHTALDQFESAYKKTPPHGELWAYMYRGEFQSPLIAEIRSKEIRLIDGTRIDAHSVRRAFKRVFSDESDH